MNITRVPRRLTFYLLIAGFCISTSADEIKIGMSKSEVIAILGNPSGTMSKGTDTIFVYKHGEVSLKNGKVISSNVLSSKEVRELKYKGSAESRVMKKFRPRTRFKIIQMFEKSALCQDQAGLMFYLHGPWISKKLMADGDTYQDDLYWAGTYSYEATEGREVTVHSYSASKEYAINIVREKFSLYDEPRTNKQSTTVIAEELKLSGTGFVICTNGYFLTCAHVVKDARTIKIRLNGQHYRASIVHTDELNDIALLKLDGDVFSPLPISPSAPEMGDKVFTIGFPNPALQGSAAKYTDGSISSLTGISNSINIMQITVPIQGGNSGGALVDAAGNIVGIIVAQLNALFAFKYTGTMPQNVNFAIKIAYAMPLIQSVPGLFRLLPNPNQTTPANLLKAVESATGLVLVY